AWWIDPRYERPAGQVLQILMVSYLVFLPVRGVALPILMGLGKPGVPTIGFLIAGLVNLGLSVALAGPLGLAGVALGTAIPNGAGGGGDRVVGRGAARRGARGRRCRAGRTPVAPAAYGLLRVAARDATGAPSRWRRVLAPRAARALRRQRGRRAGPRRAAGPV